MPQLGNLFAGFNPNALFGQLGNISRAVMTSLGQPPQPGQPAGQPDLGNIFVQISNSMFPGMPTQNVPSAPPQTNPVPPPQQATQIPQATITQIPIVIPMSQQVRPTNVQVPQQQNRPMPQPHVHYHPHTHPHNHPHNHQHLHVHPQQPISVSNHIVLPFQTLYQAGILINQLTGEGSNFPGPPLPQQGSRNNAQVIGGFLSNWHFQMMRLLPFVYRLGEILQREPGLNVTEHRQETNNLLTRITPIMNMMAGCTTEVTTLLNGFRLGSNAGQFSTTTQLNSQEAARNVPPPTQPAQSVVSPPPIQPPLIQPPLVQPPAPMMQMPPGQVSISAVIEEV